MFKKTLVPLGLMLLATAALSGAGCAPPTVTVTAPMPTPAPVVTTTVATPTTEEWIAMPNRITYDNGSSRLNDQARAMLAEAHATMQHRTDIVRVRIDGHADDGAAAERNRLLSEERALSVLDYLTGTLGMPRELFEVHHHSNTRPLTSGTTEADHATNRRVEFSILVRRQAAHY